MNAPLEIAHFTETIESQALLLRQLARDLEESRSAYIATDLESIYSHVAAQTALCDQLRETERKRSGALRALREALPPGLSPVEAAASSELQRWISSIAPEPAERLRRAITDMALAEGELRRLHRAHALMLEGSRRTIQMLANALATFSPTYSAPAAAPVGAKVGQP